jgi:hypothetical protein
MKPNDEQTHRPTPTCPYCQAPLRRTPDMTAALGTLEGLAGFLCPSGCGSFTDFEVARPNGAPLAPTEPPPNPEDDPATDGPGDAVRREDEAHIEDLNTEEEIDGYGHGV